MTISFAYESNYPSAAFPVAVGTIGWRNAKSTIVTGLIDSGADATILPVSILRQINARRGEVAWARSVTGQRYQVNLYQVNLYQVTVSIGEYTMRGVEVIANEHTGEVIWGRDVLNQLYVVLDGPGENTQIGL